MNVKLSNIKPTVQPLSHSDCFAVFSDGCDAVLDSKGRQENNGNRQVYPGVFSFVTRVEQATNQVQACARPDFAQQQQNKAGCDIRRK